MTAPLSGGREDEGGGSSSAPLVPHPASRIFPPMTDDEFTDLCKDLTAHGLVDDIVLLDGQILEGNNRYRACTETGTAPRFTVWDGDDPVGYVISKNLHRRHLTPGQKAAIAAEAEDLYKDAARRRQLKGKADLGLSAAEGLGGRALDHAAKAIGSARASAQNAKTIRAASPEIFADLKNGKVSIRQALKKTGRSGGGNNHDKPRRALKVVPTKRQAPEHVIAQARIRASDAESKYRSMLNAPEGKLNIPLLDRASKIQEILLELTGLSPEKAVSGIPAVRCREYSLEMAQWWLRFAELCDQRRRTETPDLPPLYKRPRLAALNPVVLGGPVPSAAMSPTCRAVYDWVAKQTEPVTVIEAAVAARVKRDTVGDCLRKLVSSGHVEVVGSLGSGANAFNLYQLTPEKEPG